MASSAIEGVAAGERLAKWIHDAAVMRHVINQEIVTT